MQIDDWKIDRINGHWVLLINGEFYCSGDTFAEVLDELDKLRQEKKV